MPRELADDEAVARVKAGDREAFASLLRRYQDKVYSIVSNYVGAGEDALDLTQEAFVKAYSQLPRFKGQSSFYTWLYRIAVNAALDSLRHTPQSRFVDFENLSMPDPQAGPETELLQKERSQAVQKAIAMLPESSRSVLVLREYGGLSYQEISASLDIPLGTVMSRLNYARQRLKENLISEISLPEVEYA